MVFKFRISNCNRAKCKLLLPLFMGFVTGILSVYTYYLLTKHEDDIRSIPVVTKQYNNKINSNRQSHHQVDLTKPSVYHNVSVLCLIFINDIDSLILQHNVWLEKCNSKLFIGKQKYTYFRNVVTETYSERSWKSYCQTLIYLHKQYNSGTIKYDWIFLAKDNVWLIYENLIHLISLLNTSKHNYYAGKYVNGLLSVDAGVMISSNTLISLAHLLNNMNACDIRISDNDNMLDFYLKTLRNVTPISNMDSYGCTLFHTINLFNAFSANSIKENTLKPCMSRSAITFQLDLSSNSNYHAMYYKYVLYKLRIVNKNDMSMPNNILKAQTPEDKNIWHTEALYELNVDPTNMSQKEFFNFWWKKHQIIL